MPSSHSWTYFWSEHELPPKKKKRISVLPCTHMIIKPEPLKNHHLPIILSVIQEHTLPIIAVLTECCTSRGLTFTCNSHSVSSKCQNVIYSYPWLWGQPLYQSRMGCGRALWRKQQSLSSGSQMRNRKRADISVLPEDLSDLSCRSSRLFLHALTNGKKVSAAPVELPTIFSPPANPLTAAVIHCWV